MHFFALAAVSWLLQDLYRSATVPEVKQYCRIPVKLSLEQQMPEEI